MSGFSFDNHNHKLDEAEIINYINRYPDFIVNNADKIHVFNSFKYNIFHLAQKYRTENNELKELLERFIKIAEDNFKLILSLSEINRVLSLLEKIEFAVSYIFNFFLEKMEIGFISVTWTAFGKEKPDPEDDLYLEKGKVAFVSESTLNHYFKEGVSPQVRQRKCKFLKNFFDEKSFKKLQSGVVFPLVYQKTLLGALALGSENKEKFHQELSYDFLLDTMNNISKRFFYLFLKDALLNYPERVSKKLFEQFLELKRESLFFIKELIYFEIVLKEKKIPISSINKGFHQDDIFFQIEPGTVVLVPFSYQFNKELLKKKIRNNCEGFLEDVKEKKVE